MQTITIEELHTHTGEWISKAAEHDEITVTDGGKAVAVITQPRESRMTVPVENPWRHRVLLPEYEAIMNKPVGGTDSTDIVSEMRDGR